SLQLWRGRVARGMDRGIPTPEQAEEEFSEAGIPTESLRHDPRVIAGDPPAVRAALLELAERYGVDELMLVTVTHSFEALVRSYELGADAMGLRPSGDAGGQSRGVPGVVRRRRTLPPSAGPYSATQEGP